MTSINVVPKTVTSLITSVRINSITVQPQTTTSTGSASFNVAIIDSLGQYVNYSILEMNNETYLNWRGANDDFAINWVLSQLGLTKL